MEFQEWLKEHYVKAGFISSTDELRAAWDAAVAAERERWERELSITRMALTAIRSHWREFGPECGFDETLEKACKVLEA